MTNLPPIDFTNKDAEQYKQDAIDQIPTIAPDWTDFSDTDLGIALLSLVSRMAANLGFAVDRAANEAIFIRALERKNVIDGARSLGYYPKHYISSRATVTFDFGGSNVITIPRNTRLSTTGEPRIDFVTGVERKTGISGIVDDVVCYQGIPNRSSFEAEGVANERISLVPSDVSEGIDHIQVSVNGVFWDRRESFVNSSSDSSHFVVETDGSGVTSIVFGNGTFGKIVALNSPIVVEFLRSVGRFGNVGMGKINRLVSPIIDEGVRLTSTVTNSESAVGGADPETIDQIKRRAPAFLATQGRAVTKAGYISIIEQISGIVRANAWGESEENPPNLKMFNIVKIVAAISDASLTPQFKESNRDEIHNKLVGTEEIAGVGLLTVTYRYFSPVYVPIHFDIDYEVSPSFVSDTIKGSIKDAFEAYFDIVNRSFGEKIQYSTMVLLASGRLEGYIFKGVRSVSVKMYKQPYVVSENGAAYNIDGTNKAFSYVIDNIPVAGDLAEDAMATATDIVAVINMAAAATAVNATVDLAGWAAYVHPSW